jgi:hypothetical protein
MGYCQRIGGFRVNEYDKSLKHDEPNKCLNCHQVALDYDHYAVQLPLIAGQRHIVSEVFKCQFCGNSHVVEYSYWLPHRQ